MPATNGLSEFKLTIHQLTLSKTNPTFLELKDPYMSVTYRGKTQCTMTAEAKKKKADTLAAISQKTGIPQDPSVMKALEHERIVFRGGIIYNFEHPFTVSPIQESDKVILALKDETCTNAENRIGYFEIPVTTLLARAATAKPNYYSLFYKALDAEKPKTIGGTFQMTVEHFSGKAGGQGQEKTKAELYEHQVNTKLQEIYIEESRSQRKTARDETRLMMARMNNLAENQIQRSAKPPPKRAWPLTQKYIAKVEAETPKVDLDKETRFSKDTKHYDGGEYGRPSRLSLKAKQLAPTEFEVGESQMFSGAQKRFSPTRMSRKLTHGGTSTRQSLTGRKVKGGYYYKPADPFEMAQVEEDVYDPSKLAVISSEELAEHIYDDNLKVVDCSSDFGRKEGDCPRINYLKRHVHGAHFLDIDNLRDHKTNLPFMMPSKEQFADKMKSLGISLDDFVVCYDQGESGIFAHRGAFMFEVFGHTNVKVLDGGFTKWKAEKRPMECVEAFVNQKDFAYKLQPAKIKTMAQIEKAGFQIADMRSEKEFAAGTLPGAVRLDFSKVMQGGQALPKDEFKKNLEAAGLNLNKEVCFSCVRGLSATAAYFQAKQVSNDQLSMYDGSWDEWSKKKH